MLRASSSFELFGLGGPGKEDAAASLGALATCFVLHRQTISPPSLVTHLLDPPLRGRQLPRHRHSTTSPLTPAASAESVDKGPAAQNYTAALQPDQLVDPQPDTPAPASLKKRRSRRRCSSLESQTFYQPPVESNMDNSSSLTFSGYSTPDCVNANPVAVTQSAAQHVAQSSAPLPVAQSLVQ